VNEAARPALVVVEVNEVMLQWLKGSLFLLLRWNINTFFLLGGAAMIGLLRTLL